VLSTASRAVSDGREQERIPGGLRQGGELGGDDGGEPFGRREWLGGPAPTGGRVGRDHLRQLDQCHRVARRLGQYLRPGLAARRVRLRVEQPPRVSGAQRPQDQFGNVALESGRRGAAARAEQQHERL
jgi:hypothetical protein